jgi:hypothetical protein
MKRKILIYLAISLLITFTACREKSPKGESQNPIKNDSTIVNKPKDEKKFTDYEKCLNLFNDKNYIAAYNRLKDIQRSDTEYSKAQELIKKVKPLAEIEKREDKKFEKESYDKNEKPKKMLREKYLKLIKGSGYMYIAKEKLHAKDFKEVSSGYEIAPDGSKQIKFLYRKIENNFTVDVTLQYSYSSSYYYDVFVYNKDY